MNEASYDSKFRVRQGVKVMSRDDVVRKDSAIRFDLGELSPGVAVDDDKIKLIALNNLRVALFHLNNRDYSLMDEARQRAEWLTMAEGWAKIADIDLVTLYKMIV